MNYKTNFYLKEIILQLFAKMIVG